MNQVPSSEYVSQSDEAEAARISSEGVGSVLIPDDEMRFNSWDADFTGRVG